MRPRSACPARAVLGREAGAQGGRASQPGAAHPGTDAPGGGAVAPVLRLGRGLPWAVMGRARPSGRRRPWWLVGAAAVVVAAAILPVRLAAGAVATRAAARVQAFGAARAVATAMETYYVEHGGFPVPGSERRLAQALAPFLPSAALSAHSASGFSYRPQPTAYVLRFTPAQGGPPVTLRVAAGVGGTAATGTGRATLAW